MPEWNTAQPDALTEQANIGFGRAAAALSTLLGRRILLDVPQASVLPLEQVGDALLQVLPPEVIVMRQTFRGDFNGNAFIFLAHEHAAALVDLLLGGPGKQHHLTSSDYEALMEVGNIVLNAFLGTLGNLLAVRVRFSLPQLSLSNLRTALEIQPDSTAPDQMAVLIRSHFTVRQVSLDGYLVLVLSAAALQVVQQALVE